MVFLIAMLLAAAPDAGPAWSGIAIKTPKKCTSPGPGQMVCGTTALKWADAGEDDAEKLKVMLPVLGSMLNAEPTDRDCVIGETPARCTVFAVMIEKKRVVSVFGVGTVKGRLTTFQCSGAEITDKVPSPCDAIVSQLKM